MKYLVLFLSLSLSFFSCTKEEETKYENHCLSGKHFLNTQNKK